MTPRLSNAQELSEDFYLKVAQGEVAGHKWIHKFGAVPAMSQNQSGSVWDVNDTVYPWGSFDTATQLTVSSSASEDGKSIELQGLDNDYNIVSETITLNSVTPPTTVKSYKRVYRAFMANGPNLANVNILAGATTVLRITANKSQTLMSVYTVPAGYTGYIIQGIASCQLSGDASVDFMVRYFGQTAFRVGHSFEVSGHSPYINKMAFPFPIPEKSDIDIRATVRTNNSRITASFDMLLVEN